MVDSKKTIELYTDGACSGNPGPGGWGVLLRYGHHEKEMSGFEKETTNNRMELLAVIKGLEAITRSVEVDIYTDSKYVMDGALKWLPGWLAKGWKTASKKPVKNQDLWEQLHLALKAHVVRWHWVKGHNDHPENERADALARGEVDRYLERPIHKTAQL